MENRMTFKPEIDAKKLQMISGMLNHMAPECRFIVEEVYQDYGAGIKWDTIICVRGAYDRYQMLNPKEWEAVRDAWTIEELSVIANTLFETQHHIWENRKDVRR